MRLKELLIEVVNSKVYNFENLDIKGISSDSRKIGKGEIFVALCGHAQDGHKFINDAIDNGAVCVVVDAAGALELSRAYPDIVIIAAVNSLEAFIAIARKFYKDKIKGLKLIAVTGTNGKTTVTYLIQSILNAAGFKTGIIGTIGYSFPGHSEVSHNTTPGLNELYKLFIKMRKAKVDFCIMEVSSHALEQDRVGGLEFKRAVFTNISRDHLDYHKNFANYFAAKAKLFTNLKSGYAKAIINSDDLYGRKLLEVTKVDKLTYGLSSPADIKAKGIRLNARKTDFLIERNNKAFAVNTGLPGLHNVYNILAAAALALSLKIDFKSVAKGVRGLKNVSGRLELVGKKGKAQIYIDYAHTPGALKALLEFFSALKKLEHKKRIILVFGCGGERDKIKRPQMGKIASEFADITVLTSDNPRSEDPQDIIKDIKKGRHEGARFISIEDRFKAIERAIKEANDDDIVLIAGKGHERQQIFKDRIEEFNDAHAVRQILSYL